LRELSLYLNRERRVFWAATDIFPLGRSGADPPSLQMLIGSRDAFRGMYEHLLEILGLLPRDFAAKVLPLTARLVDAECAEQQVGDVKRVSAEVVGLGCAHVLAALDGGPAPQQAP
jgi:hypothetical protein